MFRAADRAPAPSSFRGHDEYLPEVIARETQRRKNGTQFVDAIEDGSRSIACRKPMNSESSPSGAVSATCRRAPGTELARDGTVEMA